MKNDNSQDKIPTKTKMLIEKGKQLSCSHSTQILLWSSIRDTWWHI